MRACVCRSRRRSRVAGVRPRRPGPIDYVDVGHTRQQQEEEDCNIWTVRSAGGG